MLAQAGHAQAVAGAGPDDRGEDGGQQGVHDGVHADVVHGVGAERTGLGEPREPDQDGDGEGAADPGGGDGAGHRPAGDLPDDRAEHAATVEGQAGEQVEGGHDEVGDHQAGQQDAGDRTGLDGTEGAVEDAGEDEGEQRSDEGQHELPPWRLGLLLDLGDPAEELQLDTAHGQLEAERGHGVGELVDKDGGVEGDREEEGDEVAGGAELGQHPVELSAEHPGDQRGDQEPAGGDIDGHAERPAHEQPAAGVLGALRRTALGGAGVGEGAVGVGVGVPVAVGGLRERALGVATVRRARVGGVAGGGVGFLAGPGRGRCRGAGSRVAVVGDGARVVLGLLVGRGRIGARGSGGRGLTVRSALGRLVGAGPRLPAPAALVHGVPSFEASSAPAGRMGLGSMVCGRRNAFRPGTPSVSPSATAVTAGGGSLSVVGRKVCGHGDEHGGCRSGLRQ